MQGEGERFATIGSLLGPVPTLTAWTGDGEGKRHRGKGWRLGASSVRRQPSSQRALVTTVTWSAATRRKLEADVSSATA